MKRFVVVAAVIATTGLSTALAAAQPTRVSTTPPSPALPVTLFTEDFETNPAAADAPVLLNGYTGGAPLNMTYTADPTWLTDCNALIIDGNTPPADQGGTTNCSTSGLSFSRGAAAATALGVLQGLSGSAAKANHAVLYYTEANTGENPAAPLLQTAKQIPIQPTSRGHFLTLSIDAAGIDCQDEDPRLNFFLVDAANNLTSLTNSSELSTGQYDPCGSSNSSTPVTGTAFGDQAVLFNGSSTGLEIQDAALQNISGNDFEFDNVKLVDATPQLTKDFATPAVAGQPDVLTFTITNTTDLAAKNGWSFTDQLPAGMTVASTPAPTSSCGTPTIGAVTGSRTIAVTGGNLAAGASSCKVSVAVSAPRGSYTNGSGNITASAGLLLPPDTSVTFNAAPTVNNLSATTDQGTAVTVDPFTTGGDHGNHGATLNPASVKVMVGALTASVGSPISTPDGIYAVNADGTITFTPAALFTGTPSGVTYSVTDSNGVTGTANLAITVVAPPMAAPLSETTGAGHSVSINPTAASGNSAASGTSLTSTVSLSDGVHTASNTGGTTGHLTTADGTYMIAPDGTVTFTPAAGFIGAAPSVSYTITDADGGTATNTLTVTVVAGPIAKNLNETTNEGQAVTIDPTVPPNGATSPALLVNAKERLISSSGAAVTTLNTTDGTYTVDTTSGKIKFTPAPGFAGNPPPVTYSITDNLGNTARATLTVTVAGPSLHNLTAVTSPGVPVTIDPIHGGGNHGNGSDLDPTTVTLTLGSQMGDSTIPLIVSGVGTYTVDATTGKITFSPAPGFTGTAPPVTYSVTDKSGITASATLTVTVRTPLQTIPQPPPAHHAHPCNNDPNQPGGICGGSRWIAPHDRG
jgi:CshA-type fibril repeat protein